MKKPALNPCIIALSMLIVTTAEAKNKTLCQPDEQVFFSCEIGKKPIGKIVSFCTSGKQQAAPYMEYRFGRPGNIEMTYRGHAAPDTGFSRVDVLYASNASKIIWFKNQQVNYLLSLPIKGGPVLQVVKDNKTIADMACKDGWDTTIGDGEAPSPFITDKPDASAVEAEKYWKN